METSLNKPFAAPSSPRALILALAGVFLAPAVQAAGFQLSEQSVVSTGRAHAGAGVVGDDLSSVYYNPAGMSLLKGTSAQLGLSYISLDAPFKNSVTGATDNGRDKPAVVPNTFFVHQLNEQITLGLGITTPFGLAANYGEAWSGRTKGISSSIMTIDINPSIAWKANEMFSLGAGVSAQYQKASLKKGAAPAGTPGLGTASGELTADDWAYGYNFGLMFSPNQDHRIGLSYRSKIKHEAEGDYTFSGASQGFGRLPNGTIVPVNYGLWNGTYSGSATVTTPESVILSSFSRINSQWSIEGTVRWANWKRYDVLVINNGSAPIPAAGLPAIPATVIENHWKASWMYALGADYAYSPRTTFRAGLGYETSPVPSAQLRSPLIPDTSRLWVSLGASYRLNEKATVDFAYAHLRGIGDKTIDSVDAKTGVLKGEYKSLDAFILGAQLQYRF